MVAFINCLLVLFYFPISMLELLMLLLVILPWIVAFIDVLRNEFTGYNKVVWLIAVIFVPFFGPLAYLLIGRNQRINTNKFDHHDF